MDIEAASPRPSTEVAIVGAGPAGLMLAIELGCRGARCTVMEEDAVRRRTGAGAAPITTSRGTADAEPAPVLALATGQRIHRNPIERASP